VNLTSMARRSGKEKFSALDFSRETEGRGRRTFGRGEGYLYQERKTLRKRKREESGMVAQKGFWKKKKNNAVKGRIRPSVPREGRYWATYPEEGGERPLNQARSQSRQGKGGRRARDA